MQRRSHKVGINAKCDTLDSVNKNNSARKFLYCSYDGNTNFFVVYDYNSNKSVCTQFQTNRQPLLSVHYNLTVAHS